MQLNFFNLSHNASCSLSNNFIWLSSRLKKLNKSDISIDIKTNKMMLLYMFWPCGLGVNLSKPQLAQPPGEF